ncbi:MAG: EF2563 family selenium-dependent molybdenum hydroxylase system protein [Treponema sp.]|jgi:xanthine dehydrogenase accessory factor|nr:EF2563 family selenium-dependent molybdenum hydroxylase system protein [Treponema sp.]
MPVIIKGAGDLASGIALRLFHAGFDMLMTEIAAPLTVRRTVAFSRAVYEGRAAVEDAGAVLVKDEAGIREALAQKLIPVLVDPQAAIAKQLNPPALIDAIMAKKNTGTAITDAPLVIGLGPGFSAGFDCHVVIETMRGHYLGRVITKGSAIPNTGVPGGIEGFSTERLLRCSAAGVFEAKAAIGDPVRKGGEVAAVRSERGPIPIHAEIDGVLRGLLPSGIPVGKGMKAGDIDPRCEAAHCFTVSDKALAIGGGVLEALLRFLPPYALFQGGRG